MASKYTLSLASKINKSLLADFNEYLAMCEDYRKAGFRPPHCEHGTNWHVDYDPICGPCEDGRTMGDGVQRMEYALDSAKRRVEHVVKITDAMVALRGLGVLFTVEQQQPVYDELDRLLTVR